MVVPVLLKLLAGDVERAFDVVRTRASDSIRDGVQRRVPFDSVNNDHLLRIGRPLRGKRISSRIERLYDFLERTKVFSGVRIHKIQMEVIVAQFSAAVRGDCILAVRRDAIRNSDIFIRAVLVVRCGER